MIINILSEQAVIISAYIDPGTGSLIGTTLIGLGISLVFSVRGLFYKFLAKLLGRKDALDCNFENQLVFFSEGKKYFQTFKPVLEQLVKDTQHFVYLTADSDDPILEYFKDSPCATLVSLKSLHGALYSLSNLKAKMCVMTTPQLDVLSLRRSKFVKHYCHLPHSVADIHTYKRYAFDFYDSVLCANKYQIKHIRELEKRRGLPEKLLLETGCAYFQEQRLNLNNLANDKFGVLNKSRPTLCIAPTWGEKSILDKMEIIIEKVLALGYEVILRPHPQSWESDKEILSGIVDTYESKIEIDTQIDNRPSLLKSDLLICDISGIIYDFVFLYQKPVIAIIKEQTQRIIGHEDEDIEEKDAAYTFLNEMGACVRIEDIDTLSDTISTLANKKINTERFKDFVYNFDNAASVAATQIVEIYSSL